MRVDMYYPSLAGWVSVGILEDVRVPFGMRYACYDRLVAEQM